MGYMVLTAENNPWSVIDFKMDSFRVVDFKNDIHFCLQRQVFAQWQTDQILIIWIFLCEMSESWNFK